MDFYIQKNRNVLFSGDHGVGKTASVKAAFERNGLKWMYFSGATLEPYIDFVGVPRIINRDGKDVLELIQREYFTDGTIQAIFIDEFNRAPKKVTNAVMELLQFKSINGKVLPNLKVVWAAINENDDRYSVEPMDLAIADRFSIKLKIPYKPNPVFFRDRYGLSAAKNIFEWWEAIPENIRNPHVSPRRLADAIDFWLEGGDISDVLSEQKDKLNLSRLLELLNTEPIEDIMNKLMSEGDAFKIKSFINKDNNLKKAIELIRSEEKYQEVFLPHLANEKLASEMVDKSISNHVLNNYEKVPHYKNLIDSVIKTDSNIVLADQCKSFLVRNNLADKTILPIIKSQVNENVEFYTKQSKENISNTCINIKNGYNLDNLTFSQKEKIWNTLLTNIPHNESDFDHRFADISLLVRIIDKVGTGKDMYPWKRYDKFVPVLNQVCKILFESGEQPSEIRSLFSFYEDTRDSDIEGKLYIPPAKFKPRSKTERNSRVDPNSIKTKSYAPTPKMPKKSDIFFDDFETGV